MTPPLGNFETEGYSVSFMHQVPPPPTSNMFLLHCTHITFVCCKTLWYLCLALFCHMRLLYPSTTAQHAGMMGREVNYLRQIQITLRCLSIINVAASWGRAPNDVSSCCLNTTPSSACNIIIINNYNKN